MAIVLNGTTGITTPDVDSTADGSFNGVTVGRGAGSVSTNTAVGASALAATTSGDNLVGIGYGALQANTSGPRNIAVGRNALNAVTTSGDNTAVGHASLSSTTTGASNTAIGSGSLQANTTASNNVSVGYNSSYANTTGQYNSVLGTQALASNTTGSNNVALGMQSLLSNTTASNNTAVGYQAGYSGTTGFSNAYFGVSAGYSNVSGAGNTFLGVGAGYYVTGGRNTIIGQYSGNQGGLDIRTANNVIVLSDGDGNPRYYYNSGHYLTGINSGAGTYAMKWSSATGQITYDTSSARYKDNIRDSVYGLEAVMQIRSAQFEYKDDGRQDVGLIAEEVFEVIPELVALDADGNPNAVSYDRFVSVCIKAIQELNAKVDAQVAEIAALKGRA